MGLLWQTKKEKRASEQRFCAPQVRKYLPISPSAGPRIHRGAWVDLRVSFRPVRCTTKKARGSWGDSKFGVWGSGAHEEEKKTSHQEAFLGLHIWKCLT